MKLKALLASTIMAIALSVNSLSAATVSVLGYVQGNEIYSNIAPTSFTGSVFTDVSGTVKNLRRDIYEGTAMANIGLYNSVSGGATMTYSLSGKSGSTFDFIWGTVDSYNYLTLNNVGGGKEVIGGQMVHALGKFKQGESNLIVQIRAENAFESVTLSSKNNAFEHSFDQPAAIPVPAAGLLLLSALGGIAIARRKFSK